MAQLGHYMGCASASGVSVDRCLRFPSCMVFVSFGTVRRSSFQHLRPFVTAPLYGRRSSRLSTAPAVCIFAPSFSLLLPRPPGPFCEIAHLVCAVHCVLLRLSVSAVSGICLCFTGVPATHCLACGFFGTDPTRSPSYHRSFTLPNLLVRINIRNPFCREYQLPTVPQALALFPSPPSRRFFIFRRLSLQNLLADSASYRRLLTWNPVLCFC